jgi:hypothetical protein
MRRLNKRPGHIRTSELTARFSTLLTNGFDQKKQIRHTFYSVRFLFAIRRIGTRLL